MDANSAGPAAVVGRNISSKWVKTNALLESSYVARHIPASRLYSPSALADMLGSFGMVVLKPVTGTGGIGVLKVTKSGRSYQLSHRTTTQSYPSLQALASAIRRRTGRRSYLIQRGIRLATISGRPIDYRVKYVKENGRWHVRAIVGRLAKPGLFVTNLCRGGTQLAGADGISRSLSPGLVRTKKRQMRHLTKVSTAILENRFPGIASLGYDYGIDRSGQIWMLEVNTRPH